MTENIHASLTGNTMSKMQLKSTLYSKTLARNLMLKWSPRL